MNPPQHSINVHFDADPKTLHLAPAKLVVGKSQLTLNATLVNYCAPMIQAQYQLTADGAQISEVFRNSSIPAGLVSASGSLQYRTIPNRALVERLQITGDLTSARLDVKATAARTTVSNLVAHYSVIDGDATLRYLRANILGGELAAQGAIKNIEGNSHAKFSASVREVPIANLRRTFAPAETAPRVAVTGTLNANATASWSKTINDLVANADATISGQASNGPIAPQQQSGSNPTSTEMTVANSILMQGEIHALYSARDKSLSITRSALRTPQTNLTVDGTVSSASRLNVQLQANDLHEVGEIADLFSPSPDSSPLRSLALAGSATFTGTVQGSTSAPHLSGQLDAKNLQLNGTTWRVFRTNIDANPTQISLTHADLEPAPRGKLTFNASAGLSEWAFSDSSPLQLQLNASQLEISDLARITGRQIPVIGTLSANIDLHGTKLNPIGNGNVTLTHVTAYGEPVSSAEATFSGTEGTVHADLAIHAPAGTLQSKLIIQPVQRTYKAELTSDGIHLDKLQKIATSTSNLSGVVTISAKGEGSFDNPQGDALIQIPKLEFQNQNINDVKLQINVADHLARANLTSSAVGTAIQAHGQVNLTGNYLADATLDSQTIPLQPLLATYAPEQSAGITGRPRVMPLRGPLKDWRQLEAHATIPVLKLAYADTVQLAANAPIPHRLQGRSRQD